MASASAAEALSATAVTRYFGGLVAVEDMSFQLAEKEVLGPHRPERFRQDHDDEPDLRCAAAELRRNQASARRTI